MKDYYFPQGHEREAAAHSYLMSLLVVMAGLPFPIVNLAATFIFYLANRRKTYFVRWHCTQALVSQVPLFILNCVLFWWSVRVLLDFVPLSSFYFAYLFTVLLFNLVDFVATFHTMVAVNKGRQVDWYVYAPLTDLLCKPDLERP